jgi:cytochrome b6-f complex iron-sulfur subunit
MKNMETITRRDFLKAGLGILSAIAAVEVGIANLMFLRARSLEGEFGGSITAGAVTDFPPGSVTEFIEANFFLVRSEQGGFLALYRRCPHLGCTVKWSDDNQRFFCPCHASSFDKYGDFVSQPVPRALDTFKVMFKDGNVIIDTSRPETRESFSPEQLVYQS